MRGNAKTAADPGPFSGQKLRNTGDGRPPFARIALQRYVSRTMLMFRQIFDPHLSLSLSHPAIHAFLFHLRKCTGDKNVQGCIFGGILTLPWPPTLHVSPSNLYIYTRIRIRYRPPFLILLEDIRSAEHAKRFKNASHYRFSGDHGGNEIHRDKNFFLVASRFPLFKLRLPVLHQK